jgi:hypothetical protein
MSDNQQSNLYKKQLHIKLLLLIILNIENMYELITIKNIQRKR